MKKKSTLVIGVGNFLLADDGAGIHVVNQLEKMPLTSDVELLDGGTVGFELITHFQGRKKVIIIDAVKTEDDPGAVFRFKPEDLFFYKQKSFSVHQFGLHELFFFAQKMTPRPEIVVFGIVPQETKKFSTELSPAVRMGIQKMLPALLEEIGQKSL
jgi:hydrogenase maturation protease